MPKNYMVCTGGSLQALGQMVNSIREIDPNAELIGGVSFAPPQGENPDSFFMQAVVHEVQPLPPMQ